MELTKAEKRVLQSLHLQGCTGHMGNMNLQKRRALLHGLVSKGLLNGETLELTEKGIELSKH